MRSPCIGCWWQEGGLCYLPPVKYEKGYAVDVPKAESLCSSFKSKRSVFEKVIPADKLIIVSELNNK